MLKILFEGWVRIPHSYAIVLCNQIIGLHNKYVNIECPVIDMRIKEKEYYNKAWKPKDLDTIYRKEDAQILEDILNKSTDDFVPDVIYSITYPYNINVVTSNSIPKCVFYTSEFAALNESYFSGLPSDLSIDMNNIQKHITDNLDKLFFTAPSKWSANGLEQLKVPDSNNRVITHGVDLNTFYKNDDERRQYREKFGFTDNDFVILNMGAFTGNKGINTLFQLINVVANRLESNSKMKFKMVLKGIHELYNAEVLLNNYVNNELKTVITKTELDKLFNERILQFIPETLTFDEMRCMYNMCDLYISPYIAEGFNLTPLEALACGTRILISGTGSTEDYVTKIGAHMSSCADKLVMTINSKVISMPSGPGMKMNQLDSVDLLRKVLEIEKYKINIYDYARLRKFLEENYSWEHVGTLLHDYLNTIVTSDLDSKMAALNVAS
jgi:glycosyltransferase involved in cell wall biosynthesis